jgi:ABC-type ATPase with predicted acetyltransferase domain
MSDTDFLPGRFLITSGTARDYTAMQRFHYIPRRPATWAKVWAMHYHEPPQHHRPRSGPALVAVGVLSYPAPTVDMRDRIFAMAGETRARRLCFANQNIRTISRVIVHPQFRALGLAVRLVRHMCEQCPTRYLEAMAVMGHVHPLFERAGMTPYLPPRLDQPVYYLFDRITKIPTW